MKQYKVESITQGLFSTKLSRRVENLLQERTEEGWDIVSVSFGINIWWMPNAYITFTKAV